MGRAIKPTVIRLAATEIRHGSLLRLVEHPAVGGNKQTLEWMRERLDSKDDPAAILAEICGRLCYCSFPGSTKNENITRVREDPHEYIGNILKQAHGSVIEHATVTYAFLDVSRVFTHEMVRHRVGTAFSQESERFVRVSEFNLTLTPMLGQMDETSVSTLIKQIEVTLGEADDALKRGLSLDETEALSFYVKKQITSALRRFKPSGGATNLVMTANHRAWRHIIERRCVSGAEEEMPLIMNQVATDLQVYHPSIYQDLYFENGNARLKYSKV